MTISREAVIWGYRYFLGRDPESESVVSGNTQFPSLEDFARTLTASDEFHLKDRMQVLFDEARRAPATASPTASSGEMKTLRLADLPNACFLNDAARSIDGAVKLPAAAEALLGQRLRVHFHGDVDPASLTGIALDLESIPNNLEVHFSHSNQRVRFGTACQGQWLFRMWGESTATIGHGVTSNETEVFLCEGGTLEIGDDCMFATVNIHVGDSHAVFDLQTGKTLNYSPAPVVRIGTHVWLATRAVVLADTDIGAGCVVGIASIVKGRFAPASLIVGAPAQAKRTGISWTRSHDGQGVERVSALLAPLV